jgi:hypothetical protein
MSGMSEDARQIRYRDRGQGPILSWRFRHIFQVSGRAFPGINKLMREVPDGDSLACLLS